MKIGLIAMSGIRVCDTELLEMGLTLPGFVERSKVIASLPSLGLLTLAGMTPDKYVVEYIEIEDIRAYDEKSLPDDFDLVGISSYSAQMNEAYELGDRYRQMGIPVVIGGLHASVLPQEASQHCNAVVIGQGEASWSRLISDFEHDELAPRYGSLDECFDLNQAPLPAYELLDIGKYNRLTVQTSRGCPHRCEFCASSTVIAGHYQQKPAKKVLAEIDAIRNIWPRPFVEFADDNTFVNISYWEGLLPELKKRKFRWFAETDISIARHPSLLNAMREAGCAQVLIGLESPWEPGLNGLESRSNWKLKQWPDYRNAISTIQSHGISVNGCFILGLDGQNPDVFNAVYDYVDLCGLHEVQITILTAFPGTALYDRLDKSGRLIDPQAWQKLTLFDINFTPDKMTVEELRSGFHELAARIYSEEFTQIRRERFRRQMKDGLRSK